MSTRSTEETLIELTRELVQRPSENPPGQEKAVARFLAQRLRASPVPFEVEMYEVEKDRPNVVARVGDPSMGSLLLTGHMDVVPAEASEWSGDPYELRRSSGRLIGRGTSDMKGALAAKVIATEEFYRRADRTGEVILAFVVDEEWDGNGTRFMMERGMTADAAVIGEPTRTRVCVAQKGVLRFEVLIRGRSAHSGRPDEGLNAIQGMRRVLSAVEEFDRTLRRETNHEYLAPETITVTQIEGGIAPNVVPEQARMTVDWRLHPGRTREDCERRFEELLNSCQYRGEQLEWERELIVFARAVQVDLDEEIVEAARSAVREHGLEDTPVGLNASTDARFLTPRGIPTVLFGPGSIEEDAHTVDESIRVEDLVATERVYRSILKATLTEG